MFLREGQTERVYGRRNELPKIVPNVQQIRSGWVGRFRLEAINAFLLSRGERDAPRLQNVDEMLFKWKNGISSLSQYGVNGGSTRQNAADVGRVREGVRLEGAGRWKINGLAQGYSGITSVQSPLDVIMSPISRWV